jgi:UDP-glucose 4-epimerase
MDVHGVYTEVMIRWLERLRAGQAPIIFGDGMQTMDFLYVEDLARAYVLAANSEATDVVLNAGSGRETSLLELCRQLSTAAGHPGVEPEFAPARTVNPVTRRLASVDAARDTIGFEAEVNLADGLKRLVDWHAALSLETVAAK